MDLYIVQSLETHLFFGRIMKEHSLFLEGAFPAKETRWIRRASRFREEFETFLEEVVKLSDGVVRSEVLESGEVVTPFTLFAERKTVHYTGIPINTQITIAQQRLKGIQRGCSSQEGKCPRERNDMELRRNVRVLNQRALQMLRGLIRLKEEILAEMLNCSLYTFNYPLLIQHITREARLYQSFVMHLERTGMLCTRDMQELEVFWNQIMMEHALFIRGLLDPSEEELIRTADEFSREYACLLEAAREADSRAALAALTEKTREETEKYRDFKAAGTKGINGCEISSIILPLLADHVLREANHYLRILQG